MLHAQINAKFFLEDLTAGYDGLEWLQQMLTQSVNNDEKVILKELIENHPSSHTQETNLAKKRKPILSEVRGSLYAHGQDRQGPQTKHIRFSDEETSGFVKIER